ncbi:hypothetical protein P9G84_08015 [Brevibacillus centrosporus]|uniref:hypothetical protein n=1 Tax=Brevibacillus TaxID=55080 RepID=UPI000F0A73FB|nr:MULTISPECIES: hypothetical protein [Brevibacillus]TGV30140.1 hypothetical protein EN829_037915 [Mesorhizobium sp. M00.F.Ca.ET.186.01.1.1]MEC2128940.1 hypothetical protein [Brevibacillus centrosporus]MED1726145.1 hypothetical protein [Brevibacillus parabrevis]RNB70204.1 hypothetical protein EDM55_12075 [Brevibacillus centrosporus]GED33948.1 hypothetical protein BCE02nite_50890 [Brevibacillus centrosporus]
MQYLANLILIFSLTFTVVCIFRAVNQYKKGNVAEKKKLVKTGLISFGITLIAIVFVTMLIVSSS